MSLEEKVGQLMVAPLCPTHRERHVEGLKRLVRERHVGGIIVMGGEAPLQQKLLAELQEGRELPLLTLQDAEKGVGMRLKDVPPLPQNLTLGAVQDKDLLRAFGREVARQCHAVGIMSPLAPVVDVNSNPSNPVIHQRSFGDDPHEVAERGLAVMEGMREGGVLSCVKHFPGHGDTAVDSHRGLPRIEKSLAEMSTLELAPFQRMIDAGVDMVMVGHLLFPALSPLPATLSPEVMTHLLREEMGFKGLIVTDALNMSALSARYGVEEEVMGAFQGGADLLLTATAYPVVSAFLIETGIPRAIDLLVEKCRTGEISEAEIDERVERILEVRKRMKKVEVEEDEELTQKLFDAAITVVGKPLVPLRRGEKVALLQSSPDEDLEALLGSSSDGEGSRVVVRYREGDSVSLIPEEAIILVLDTPYLLSQLPEDRTILVGYEDRIEAKRALVQVLYGEKPPLGKLPVRIR